MQMPRSGAMPTEADSSVGGAVRPTERTQHALQRLPGMRNTDYYIWGANGLLCQGPEIGKELSIMRRYSRRNHCRC
jgi:hypothetical protein